MAQQSDPNFNMVGFCTLNGGTTGGEGGQVVIPQSFDELKLYVENTSTPYVIQIEKEFNTGVSTWVDADGSLVDNNSTDAIATTFGAILKIGSNKTLIGIGDKAFLNRIGLVIQCQSNIIIRNIRFTMKDVPATREDEYKILDTDGITTIGDPDCIGIQADKDDIPETQRISEHIWIDHCEFYNENVANKDRYDGLVDNKNNVQHFTISWCYFHDHSKALLSGKGSSDNYNRTITFHHNYFSKIDGSRLPLLRFGQHHYFNNFIENCEGDGVNVRINSNCYIENNYFKNAKKPVFGKISENGQAKLVENIFESCSRLPEGITNIDGAKSDPLSSSEEFVRECNFVPSDLYSYIDVLTTTENVPTIVKSFSGVGKIPTGSANIQSDHWQNVKITSTYDGLIIHVDKAMVARIYNVNGKLLNHTKLAANDNFIPLPTNSIYIVKITDGSTQNVWKIVM